MQVKYIMHMGIRSYQGVYKQHILACKYIAPMDIEMVSASVQNILACKYIAPTGIEVVSASLQNVLNISYLVCKYFTTCMVVK